MTTDTATETSSGVECLSPRHDSSDDARRAGVEVQDECGPIAVVTP